MKQNGFISSALLYSILALFLVVMLSTVAVLGNRKLSLDKLKDNALTTVGAGYSSPESIYAIYDGYQMPQVSGTGIVFWKDMSNNAHDAVLNNYYNNYDNSDHFIDFQNDISVNTKIRQGDLGNSFTISVVLLTSESGGGIWGYSDNNVGIYANATSDGIDVCYYAKGSSVSCVQIDNNNIKVFDKKIELTAVYESGNGVYAYVNGVGVGNGSSGGSFPAVNDNDLYFGLSNSLNSENVNYFSGNIYNIVINKSALSDEQIVSNYIYDKERFGI